MNLPILFRKYNTENKCMLFFKAAKEQQGIVCKKCGGARHYWNKTAKAHDCCNCRYRTTLRSGTVMEASKLPFQYWLYTIFYMTMSKKSISALEMQRQLGHKFYEPIWFMMHKLRAAMGLRDLKYNLDGVVEIDDAFFKTHIESKDEKDQLKRGRGSQSQSTVLVMAKVDPKVGRPKKHKKQSAFRFVKMVVIPNSSANTMNETVSANMSENVKIKSDGWRGFNKIKEVVSAHIKKVVTPKEASKVLPWVHTMISNAKRTLLGINHNIKEEYLQNYLNEFCYKTNRRYFGDKLFERLIIAAVEDTWYGKFRYKS